VVIYAGNAMTQPWPGKEVWTDGQSYWTMNNADAIVGAGGIIADRPYDDFAFGNWDKKPAQDNYPIL
jgi:hypothetical protein